MSRLLGLVREQVFAALLGAGLYADAFQIAFRIPNLLRDLFAEGALSSAFVPTYARTLAAGGREAGASAGLARCSPCSRSCSGRSSSWGSCSRTRWWRHSPPASTRSPASEPFAVLLTRMMMPFLPLVSFAAVAMGMLNAEERFAAPAIAPAMFNLVAILWGAGLWGMGFSPRDVALGWALGTLLSGAAQFLVQVPPLRRMGWRFRPEWAPGDPDIRRIVGLMGPSIVGLAAVQLNIFLNSIFASHAPGAVSWLNYAFRILYLPIGLFGVALGTIATSGLARRAAAGDMDGLRATLRDALSLLAFLTVPATLGLMVLAEPVVRLLYERGAFTAADTQSTATALVCYGVGLVAYTGVKVLAPAFYALGTARVPLVGTVLAVLTNVTVMVVGFPVLSFKAVALGTGLGSFVNALVLFVVFERRVGGLRGSGLGGRLLRVVAASLAMAALAGLAAGQLTRLVGTHGFFAQATVGLVPVVLGVAVYEGLALVLGIPEAKTVLRMLRRRP